MAVRIEAATPMTYAYRLAGRHSDIGFIIAQVKREFGRAPSRKQIEAMRSEILRKREREATKYDRCRDSGAEARLYRECAA